jgi:branched-chain amino acid transport system ATP-binding protein
MLSVKGIDSCYGEFRVLHNVSLEVADGELVVAFGPNGHGKSTLLKSICGLHPPVSGSVTFNGQEISKLPMLDIVKMGVVYIAEDRHLFPRMTIMENLRLGAYCRNARPKEAESLEYVFALFPRLKERMKSQAQTLSGGEARMLAIGRGLMSNAKLLLIDEPSLGLAPNTRAEVFKKISEINKGGITVLMVEQDITEAAEYADRIYLMEDGNIVFEGTEEEVLKNPHVRDVFLGL